jgi:cytochrome b
MNKMETDELPTVVGVGSAADGDNGLPVWDLPTRLCHWLIVASIVGCWWTGKYGALDYHIYCGYLVLSLLIYRLYWGFLGSETARFVNFIRGPRTVWLYILSLPKNTPSTIVGHNPLGAISVLTLLAFMIAQVSLGLFAVDIDGLESGPLSQYVSFALGRNFARWHNSCFNFLFAAILIHAAAIAFYLIYKRENLVVPMLVGKKRVATATDQRQSRPSPMRAMFGVAISVLVTWAIARGLRL